MGKKQKRLEKIEKEIIDLKIHNMLDGETIKAMQKELSHYRNHQKWPGGYASAAVDWETFNDKSSLRNYRIKDIKRTFDSEDKC